MKKTLTMLFAAASMVMAADDLQPLNLTFSVVEEGNGVVKKEATLTPSDFASNEFTIVLTLDFKNMPIGGGNLFSVNGSTYYPLLPGETDPGALGMKYFYEFDGYFLEETSKIQYTVNTVNTAMPYEYNLLDSDLNGVMPEYADVVYTYKVEDNVGKLSTTMYLYDGNHEKIDDYIRDSYTTTKNYIASYTSVDIFSSAVTDFQMYNIALKGEQIQTALDALKGNNTPSAPGDGNVPEPTTATLSLLALAGLAARRRRK